jgi:hypothetical protein
MAKKNQCKKMSESQDLNFHIGMNFLNFKISILMQVLK